MRGLSLGAGVAAGVLALTGVPGGAAAAPPASAATTAAPGGPGHAPPFLPADKQGFATAYGAAGSRVWLTLERGALSEVYYPDLGTPSVRELQLVVSDGRSFTDVERSATVPRVRLLDPASLTYQQVDTARSGRYVITKTYVTDPARSTVVVHVGFRSLTGRSYHVYVLLEPTLGNDPGHDTATTVHHALLAHSSTAASALAARPALGASTNGFLGADNGLTELAAHHRLTHHYRTAADGAVAQVALTGLTGLPGHRTLDLALGFGRHTGEAWAAATSSLATGFPTLARGYAAGWHRYLAGLHPVPADAARWATEYRVAEMVLAAGEDKAHPGAFVASPTMPWEWGTAAGHQPKPSGPYHLVWARDLYQIATALLLDGDRAAAARAEHFLFFVQQRPDGSFPQNSTVAGVPYWTGEQLDEYSLPTVLAWMLRDHSAAVWRHVQLAESQVVRLGPVTGQDRWENQSGYSPATLAAEVAGLVCAAAMAHWHGEGALARHYLAVADRWRAAITGWAVTSNGPLSSRPYYLRLTKNGRPDTGVRYAIGDSGPSSVDQRAVVDPSFLELVRLGVEPARSTDVTDTLRVVDRTLLVRTPEGPMFHRYSYDGYGETATGGPWVIAGPGTPRTYGRVWPLLTGERGEYALAAVPGGRTAVAPAGADLAAMAGADNAGFLLPEQVWDGRPPTGRPGFALGTPTRSATPLLWSEAQFIRLALDLQSGRVLERPSVVACRYVGC